MNSKKIIVKGLVQGVFFRKYTKLKADEIGVKGFVRNEPDGTVYIEIEGNNQAIEEMIHWCHNGPAEAVVDEVIENTQKLKDYKNFDVSY
jgi:acylphosphatase